MNIFITLIITKIGQNTETSLIWIVICLTGDYAALSFENGRVVFRMKSGANPAMALPSQRSTYADDEFHIISVEATNGNVFMSVDGTDRTTTPYNGQSYSGPSTVYTGGVPKVG